MDFDQLLPKSSQVTAAELGLLTPPPSPKSETAPSTETRPATMQTAPASPSTQAAPAPPSTQTTPTGLAQATAKAAHQESATLQLA